MSVNKGAVIINKILKQVKVNVKKIEMCRKVSCHDNVIDYRLYLVSSPKLCFLEKKLMPLKCL